MVKQVTSFGCVLLLVAAASSTAAQTVNSSPCLTRFGQKEWSLLLKDIEPAKRRELLANKDRLREQAENLQQLFALTCEAIKRRVADEPRNKTELGSIRSEVVALAYDTRIRKAKTDAPFAWITDTEIEKFYSAAARETEFERFFEAKVDLLHQSSPDMADRVPSAEERKSARDFFATIKIAEAATAPLVEPFKSEVELKVRMQQAQFLARQMAEILADDLAVTDEDVGDYIAANPVYSDEPKRAVAAKILERAKAGEDFAALADRYSEDPGNVAADGKKNGGLYANVPVGMMVPPFEKASLALEPGQIAVDLVKTDYGFHVIKLERKAADGMRYDVRHILILSGYKDPNDPTAKEVPAVVYVRTKLETERETAVMDRIVAQNPIVVEEYKPAPPVPAKRPVRKRRR